MCVDKQNHKPLVSVIMPAYNAAEYIAEAIDSVLGQTVSDFEFIIVDDCSCDSTREIVLDFQKKDSRIRLLLNDSNMGVARTRNRGIDECSGKYVALLDSDDYWKPQMLEKMIARVEDANADIVYCSYEIVDENGVKLCNDFIVPPETTFKESIVRSVITCSSVLMTLELAKNNKFPTNMYHEDIAVWFQILKDGYIARGVQEVLAAYRQRANSRSSSKIRNAWKRWEIYRKHLRMSLPETVVTMVRYGYYGLIKFKRI